MYYNLVSETRVKAGRKKCWCHDCQDEIEVGQPRLVRWWSEGRYIHPWNTCSKCDDFLVAAREWMRRNRATAARLANSIYHEDGYEIGWLKTSFEEGIEIRGLVIRDREAATAYLKELLEQQNQAEAV